jgi:predicted MFS family arabinose efflux permease
VDTDASKPKALSNGMRNWTLFILTIVYAFNFIDRQILVVMQEAIKTELGLSDTQLGLLSGFSFAIFYVSVGIPVAYWADRANRRNIISIALAVWSGMTALSGLAQNYTQLLLARIGVGVGEAGGSPPAHSMISDMFKPKQRSTALAIYSAGLYLGVVIGYGSGGILSEEFGWRNTFFIVGIPGVLLAILLRFSVKEPARGTFESLSLEDKPSFKETMVALFKLKSFPYFAFGCAMSGFVSYGTSNFVPSLMVRYHDMAPGEIGITLAATGGVGGMIGTFLGGYLTDRIGAKDVRWYLWLPGLTAVLAIPFMMWAFQTDNTRLMLWLYFGVSIGGTLYLAPSIATAHRLVHPRMRAMASAILFFILNLIGLGLGPLAVGALSDFLRELYGNTEQLRLALTIAAGVAMIKGYLFYMGGKKLPEDIAKIEGETKA